MLLFSFGDLFLKFYYIDDNKSIVYMAKLIDQYILHEDKVIWVGDERKVYLSTCQRDKKEYAVKTVSKNIFKNDKGY